jgi:hypothetical protein
MTNYTTPDALIAAAAGATMYRTTAAAAPSLSYCGQGVVVIDENDAVWAWNGSAYELPEAAGGAANFSDLADVPEGYEGGAGLVPSVKADESGLEYTDHIYIDKDTDQVAFEADSLLADMGSQGILLMATGGPAELRATGDGVASLKHQGAGTGGVDISAAGDWGVTISGETVDITATTLTLNGGGETAVASQSVLVAGVGTMVFTNGILTSFTPA